MLSLRTPKRVRDVPGMLSCSPQLLQTRLWPAAVRGKRRQRVGAVCQLRNTCADDEHARERLFTCAFSWVTRACEYVCVRGMEWDGTYNK